MKVSFIRVPCPETHSDIRWPRDQANATLTGMSFPTCNVRVTFAFSELSELGWRASRYCGLIMKLGCVQLPPAVFDVKEPDTLFSITLELSQESLVTYFLFIGRWLLVFNPRQFHGLLRKNSQRISNVGSIPLIRSWDQQNSGSLRRQYPDPVLKSIVMWVFRSAQRIDTY